MKVFQGDKVAVNLPAGEYIGVVQEIRRDYMWTGEDWYRVTGTEPKPFITTCREVRPV